MNIYIIAYINLDNLYNRCRNFDQVKCVKIKILCSWLKMRFKNILLWEITKWKFWWNNFRRA